MHQRIKYFTSLLLFGLTIFTYGQSDSTWLNVVRYGEPLSVQVDSVLAFCDRHQNQLTEQKLRLLKRILPRIDTLDSDQKAAFFLTYSQVYLENEDYDHTLEYALNAGGLTSMINNQLAMHIEGHLASVYYLLSDMENSLQYTQNAYERSLALQDSSGVAAGFSRMGELFRKIGQRDSAYYYLNQAILMWSELDDARGLAKAYNNLGIYHIQTHPTSLEIQNQAIRAWEQSLRYKAKIGDSLGMIGSHLNIAMATGEPQGGQEKIEHHLNQAIDLAEKLNNVRGLRAVYKDASHHYSNFGHFEKAFLAQKEYQKYHEVLMSENTRERIAELEVAHETDLKEQNIELLSAQTAAQENRLQKQQWVLGLSAGLLVLLMMILFIVRRNAQLKFARKEQEVRLNTLIHTKEMEALKHAEHLNKVKALLDGQEMERKRIARDLHDQMGAMMSAIRMNIEALDQQNGLAREDLFTRTKELVTQAGKEIRRTAHNLMPASIDKYGLEMAVRSKIAQLDQSALSIQFQSNGMEQRLPQNIEIHLYRIIQEMIQNAVKHSRAQELLIDLSADEGSIHLVVEDNGNGIDQSLEEIEGMGISNIRSRVAALGGEFTIESKPGTGTSFDIFINRKEKT